MPAIRVAVTIDAPPGQVWRAIEDIATHVEWMADAEAIRFTSPRRRGVGTTFECDTRVGPFRLVDRMEVTEWRPGQVMGVAHTGLVTGRGRFRLTPLPGGRTRFTWREELHFPWWLGGSIGAVVGGEVLRLIWRQNLRRLKRLVEG
ncbi:MAG: SRPBCC family protein [Acidimicrobiales bacterium]